MDYFSHFFGFFSLVFYLSSDLQSDDKKLDFYYTIGNIMFFFHLVLLSSFWPATTVFLAVIRNIFNYKYKENKNIKIFFIITFLFIFITAIYNLDTWSDPIPALVSLIMTFAFLYTRGHVLTLAGVICSLLWICVGIDINSKYILITEILSIFFLLYRTKNIISKEK